MKELFRPFLELSVLFPSVMLAYLPVKNKLKFQRSRVILFMSILLTALWLGGGFLCYSLKIRTIGVMVFCVLLIGVVYVHTLDVSSWKSFNVLLAVCAIYACINGICRSINALVSDDPSGIWFCIYGGISYNLFCLGFTALAWYPASNAIAHLVDDEKMAFSWYFYWIMPAVFICLNLFIIPKNSDTLYIGRVMQAYVVICLVLLAILVLFYWLFYHIARSLSQNDRLLQENQFLSMQQAQYHALIEAVEETREVRHDMRHHFALLSSLAKNRQWAELEKYLDQVQKRIPNTDLMFCANPAVNGVAGHYAALFRRAKIPCSMKFDLPGSFTADEMDICLVLSNLLENALEASARIPADQRNVQVSVRLHSRNVLIIAVENCYVGDIREKDGVFQSSKRKGSGIGLQSVRRIAEKNGGQCRFGYEDGVFSANVMLRTHDSLGVTPTGA